METTQAPELPYLESWIPKTSQLIVLKPNLGYCKPHPATVRVPFLETVISKILRHAPEARIAVLEGVTFAGNADEAFAWHGLKEDFWPDGRVQLLDADRCDLMDYNNPAPELERFAVVRAPAILREADACISIAPLKRTILNGRPLISGTSKNLFGLLPRAHYRARSPNSRGMLHRPSVFRVIPEIVRTLAPFFRGAILDLHQWFDGPDWHPDRGKPRESGHIIAGPDLDWVDVLACRQAGIEPDERLAKVSPPDHSNS